MKLPAYAFAAGFASGFFWALYVPAAAIDAALAAALWDVAIVGTVAVANQLWARARFGISIWLAYAFGSGMATWMVVRYF